MLGASPEEHILKEREGPSSLCNYLCGRDSHTGAQPQHLGSIHMAAGCSHAMDPHGGGAVQLLPWSSHRPWAHNASDAVQGD